MRKFLISILLLCTLFIHAASRYWVGGGASTNWNATGNTNWSATSGGSNNASVPGSTDDVFFDSHSGTAVLTASTTIQSFDCTGYTGTLTHNASVILTISGVGGICKFVNTMAYNPAAATSVINFSAASGTTALTCGQTPIQSIRINGAAITVQCQDNLTVTSELRLRKGTFDSNGKTVSALYFWFDAQAAGTLIITNSVVTISGSDADNTAAWEDDSNGASLLTVNGTGSTIKFTNTTANAKSFQNANTETFGLIWFTGTGTGAYKFIGGTGTYDIIRDNNTATHTVTFIHSVTYTINNSWEVKGTAGHLITVNSDLSGTFFTVTKANSGTVSTDYLSIKDSHVGGSGSLWYAGANSTNTSGNSGWTFSAAPIGTGFFYLTR